MVDEKLKKYNSRKLGHKQGVKTVEKLFKATINHKIKTFNIIYFSHRELEEDQNMKLIFI